MANKRVSPKITGDKQPVSWHDQTVKKYAEDYDKRGCTQIRAQYPGSRFPAPEPIAGHVPDLTCIDFAGRQMIVQVEDEAGVDEANTGAAWRTFAKYAFFNTTCSFILVVPAAIKQDAERVLHGFCVRGSVVGA